MPTNTRTPSGGTTTAGGLCVIGGADEASQIQSLTERVAKLEKILALYMGGDVEAGQLSDISQNAGWLYVEYMGKPGWLQNPITGTLIPPAGVTFHDMGLGALVDYPCNPFDSSGNLKAGLRMSVYDENGDLQLGTDCDGQLHGAKVDQWDAAGTDEPDYALYHFGAPPVQESRGITWDSLSTSGHAFAATLTVAQAGLYLVNAMGSWDYTITTFGAIQVSCSIASKTSGGATIDSTKTSSVGAFVETNPGADSGDNVVGTSNVNMYNLTAGQKISIDLAALLTDGAAYDGSTMADVNVSVLRVGAGE